MTRWHGTIATCVYALATVLITWPAIAQFSTHVAGFADRDSLQYTWALWWARQAHNMGLGPADTVLLYWPNQARNVLLAVAPLLDWLAFPLQGWLSPTQVYNALFLGSLTLSALAMYALVRERTGSFWGALLAGAVYAYSAPRLGHALLGHLSHLAAWWLPLAVLYGLRVLDRPLLRDAALGGLCAALGVLVAPVQAAYLVVPGLLVLLGCEALRRRRELHRQHLQMGLVAVAITAAVILPVYLPFLRIVFGDTLDLGAQGIEDYSVDPAMLLLPSPYHPVWGEFTRGIGFVMKQMPEANDLEKIAYVGVLPLGLAIWGWWQSKRERWPWLALLLIAVGLSMGPALRFAGRDTGLRLPYALLMRLPLLAWGRTPERFLQLVSFAIAMLVGLALSDWRPRWPMGVALLMACLLGSLTMWPFPQGTPLPPTEISLWRDESGVVLELPNSKRQVGNLAMYHQTEHGLPIVGGYIHRDPPGQRDYVKAIDSAILTQGDHAWRPLTEAELRMLLQGLDIRYTVLHASYMKADELADAEARLGSALGTSARQVGDLVVYSVPSRARPFEAEVVFAEQLGLEISELRYDGGCLNVSLTWQAQTAIDRDWTVFVHVRDAEGNTLGQHDGWPAGGNLPTSLWAEGQLVYDEHRIPGLAELDAKWEVAIGLYVQESGERADASSSAHEVSDAAVIVTLFERPVTP